MPLKHPAALEESPKASMATYVHGFRIFTRGGLSDGAGCVGLSFHWSDDTTTSGLTAAPSKAARLACS